jgi:hypothetical protein
LSVAGKIYEFVSGTNRIYQLNDDEEEEGCRLFGHDRPRAFFQAPAKPGATS